MTGCPSMKASEGIRPTPSGSSASTSGALLVRQTGEWLASVSSTQIWFPVHPAGVWPGLQEALALLAQRSLVAVAGSTTHTWVLVQALLQGGAGRSWASTSPPTVLPEPITTQSLALSGWVLVAMT